VDTDTKPRYLRALAAMYIRMTFRAVEVYDLLEPLLKDFRRLRMRSMGTSLSYTPRNLTVIAWIAGYTLTFMDEFVDSLLVEERVCDIILPRLQKRQILEENGDIGPRKSRLLDAMEGNSDRGSTRGRPRSGSVTSSLSRSGSNESRGSARYISRSPSRSRSGSPGSPSRFVSRSRSVSKSSRSGSRSPNIMQTDD